MLLPASTLLARARRKKQLVLCCQVSTVEMLIGVLDAATLAKRDLIIEIDTTANGLPLDIFSRVAHELIEKHPQSVGLMAGVAPTAAAFARVSSHAFPSVRPLFKKDESAMVQLEFANWAHESVKSHGSEVAATLGIWKSGTELRTFVEDTGVHFIVMPAFHAGPSQLEPSKIRESAAKAGVPLVSSDENLPVTQIRRLKDAGVSGLLLSQTLTKAYTAGVRAGLHDKHVFSPTVYQAKGALAVKHTVIHYLQAF